MSRALAPLASRAAAPLAVVLAVALAGCVASPPTPAASAPAADVERPDWARFFRAEGVAGTFVLYDPAAGVAQRYDPARAARRFLPASTFKVYNALVALETGVVADPDSAFAWDGVQREVPAWNRDHTLRTGLESSVVWLYQRVARRVGRDRYLATFARQPVGNGQIGPDVGLFWLDNSLQVSADEQVAFVDGLRRGALAFRPDVQATVRGMLPVLADTAGARVVGKTGLGRQPDGALLGWLVGWVERDGRAAVFAMNAEPDPGAAREIDVAGSRLRVVHAVLASEGWLAAGAGGKP